MLSTLIAHPDVANAFAAIASAVAAVLGLLVSGIALYVAHSTLKHQRKHDVLSVRPLPAISVGDYEDRLTVAIKNHGTGPLLISDVSVSSPEGARPALIEHMPELPDGVQWSTFVADVSDRAVLPGDAITLLELVGDPDDAQFIQARDLVRGALSALTISVGYTDIYGSSRRTAQRELHWFGRLLQDQ